jgi:uncharacterized protein YjbJ (UPF0337 family)
VYGVDKNRIKGKRKEIEGRLQREVGEAKDKVRDLPDDAKARIEREKGKREAKREMQR